MAAGQSLMTGFTLDTTAALLRSMTKKAGSIRMTRDESAMTDRELMQQALDAFEKIVEGCRGVKSANPVHKDARDLATFVIVDCREPIKSISDRLAQPEPEPVWVEVTTNTGDKFILDSAVEADKIRAARDAGLSVVPLYTAPPQREWQGLTDEEVRDLWSWSMTAEAERTANTQQHAFARAIEAKLKDKNHAV